MKIGNIIPKVPRDRIKAYSAPCNPVNTEPFRKGKDKFDKDRNTERRRKEKPGNKDSGKTESESKSSQKGIDKNKLAAVGFTDTYSTMQLSDDTSAGSWGYTITAKQRESITFHPSQGLLFYFLMKLRKFTGINLR